MRPALVVILAVTSLALAGCGGTASPDPAPTPTNIKVEKDSGYAAVIKPTVEGTELLCFTHGTYGATSCNWELWNKQREAAK